MRSKPISAVRANRNGTEPGAAERSSTTSPSPDAVQARRNGHHCTRTDIETLLFRFETYLQQHALAPVTIRNYVADLRAFSRWHATRHHRGLAFVPADFCAYREHLCNETGHSTATVNRRLQSLRLFGRFLLEVGQVKENPTRGIELVHNGNGNGNLRPRTLTPREITRLSNAVRAGRPSLVLRDLAIVELMLRAGLRVHEVAALRLQDLIPGRRGTKVQVHSSRPAAQRAVPLDESATETVRRYLAVRPAIPRVEHLFVSQRGQPLSMRSIQRIIDTYAHAAGLKHVCAQSLRHTCAKIMLESTRDTALVARWLGHTSTRILGKYK